MSTFDLIVLFTFLIIAVVGAAIGFGKGLKTFTKGWPGRIISLVVCYFLFGVVYSWGWVQDTLTNYLALFNEENAILNILRTIRIDVITFVIVLFVVVQLLRIIVVAIIDKIVETDTPVMIVINKVLGVALFLGAALVLILIFFQICAMVGKGTEGVVYKTIEGSFFGLDKLYLDNPLKKAIEQIKLK